MPLFKFANFTASSTGGFRMHVSDRVIPFCRGMRRVFLCRKSGSNSGPPEPYQLRTPPSPNSLPIGARGRLLATAHSAPGARWMCEANGPSDPGKEKEKGKSHLSAREMSNSSPSPGEASFALRTSRPASTAKAERHLQGLHADQCQQQSGQAAAGHPQEILRYAPHFATRERRACMIVTLPGPRDGTKKDHNPRRKPPPGLSDVLRANPTFP